MICMLPWSNEWQNLQRWLFLGHRGTVPAPAESSFFFPERQVPLVESSIDELRLQEE